MKISWSICAVFVVSLPPSLARADDRAATQAEAMHEGAKVDNFVANGHADGSAGLEMPSFRSGPQGRAIEYAHGRDAGKTIELRLLGNLPEGRGLAVQFPNGHVLNVEIERNTLLVSGRSGSYRKCYIWHYEGPVEGRGTFCEPCVPESLAIPFVRENFTQDPSR